MRTGIITFLVKLIPLGVTRVNFEGMQAETVGRDAEHGQRRHVRRPQGLV